MVQLVRFVGVGGLATLTHVIVASAAFQLLSIEEIWANLCGFGAAFLVSYAGHSRFTFAADTSHDGQFGRFLFVALTGLAASSLIVWIVDAAGGQFLLSMAFVAFLVPFASFLGMKFWVFSHRETLHWPTLPMVLTAFVAVVVFLYVFWDWPINHDTAWYLVATRKMLGGARLYVDIIEVNPPLNFYYTIPALFIADLFNVSDTNGQYLAFSTLYLVSLLWSGAILRRVSTLSAIRTHVFFLFMALVLVLAAVSQVAQRDHLLVLFLMPWAISYLDEAQKPPSLASCAFAAAGICLKPFFLIFPLVMFLRDVWNTRSAKPLVYPQYLLMLAIGVGYVLFVKLVHPEYLDEIAPMAMHVYGAFKTTLFGVLLVQLAPLLLCMMALMSLMTIPAARSNVFVFLALAGFVCYLLQSTGFRYHLIPLNCFALLACAWMLLSFPKFVRSLAPAVMGCCLLMLGLWQTGRYESDYINKVVHQTQLLGPVTSLFTASTSIDPGAPVALRMGIDWTSRYPHNWLYPGAFKSLAATDCNSQPDLCDLLLSFADKNRSDNIEDIIRNQPDILVVDRIDPQFHDDLISWVTFMEEDSRFVEVMQNYDLVHSTREVDYYLRSNLN